MARPKIMIADDNNLILEITAGLFSEAGFDVVKRDGPLGTSAEVGREKPACVLLDINMPAISGDKMIGMIKRNSTSEVKILLHSDRS